MITTKGSLSGLPFLFYPIKMLYMTTELNTENREYIYITWQYQQLNFGLLGGLRLKGWKECG